MEYNYWREKCEELEKSRRKVIRYRYLTVGMLLVILYLTVCVVPSGEASERDAKVVSSLLAECANGHTVAFGESALTCRVTEMVKL